MATLFSLIEVIHLKKLYCIQDSLYYHTLLFTTTFFSYFYIFSVYLFLFLCLYVITMFYHFCSLLFIYHFISKIFSIYFQTCIFQFLQTYIFQFLQKLIHFLLWCILYFCFFVISQVKKTTTKIQGALDEDQESQVINTFSIHIIPVSCLLTSC